MSSPNNGAQAAACACLTVKYDPIDNGDGTWTERWRCRDCGMPFAKALGVLDVNDERAPADERRWKVKIENGRLTVQTWNDARTWHDTLVLERRGPMLRVKLPVHGDLRELVEQFPALAHIAPVVVAKRRLVEAGAPEDLAPQLIHTKVAVACWPIFGMHDPCPLAGAAVFFGVRAVWAPALDQFVTDPDAK